MDIVGQAEGFHGLLLENKRKQLYLLKPLGGSTSFLESKFFREIYNKADFKNTYLDEFLGDAYTIINPYTFLVADYLAKSVGIQYIYRNTWAAAAAVVVELDGSTSFFVRYQFRIPV